MSSPPTEVLDLFAVPHVVEPLPGGSGRSVRAGDLVLSPGRDEATAAWLNPVLARLAVRLDESPTRRPRDLRIAMPVPARDGAWVVAGWGASRYEPGTTGCDDLDVTLAAGRLLHAELASVVGRPPAALAARTDRAALAERAAFGAVGELSGPVAGRVAPLLDDTPLGPDQLVHTALHGNVLLDAAGAPVVLDVTPAWRPTLWAEALAVLDAVLAADAPLSVLQRWTTARERQAMLRALLFRVLANDVQALAPYAPVLAVLTGG
ncbi:aminoglycoside phosphotransferase [Nocardioides dongxiaopingii]|uniref:aminoglycoside phosphotransferase n=1 Tax=Nocardioides sp. S-1144 TaxID=2582905 RepID=UPI00110E7411|nr:aminoglycoside phosphotransferase [Nocardioides sp. S-1144]QCW50037.1 aminoglycoside phosphotransferase [Nocardioides sp. S-1144]